MGFPFLREWEDEQKSPLERKLCKMLQIFYKLQNLFSVFGRIYRVVFLKKIDIFLNQHPDEEALNSCFPFTYALTQRPLERA